MHEKKEVKIKKEKKKEQLNSVGKRDSVNFRNFNTVLSRNWHSGLSFLRLTWHAASCPAPIMGKVTHYLYLYKYENVCVSVCVFAFFSAIS